jgi:hypothetical protein
VRKLIRDAERQGFLSRSPDADDRISLHPQLTEGALNFFATVFLFIARCARQAMDTSAPQSRPG